MWEAIRVCGTHRGQLVDLKDDIVQKSLIFYILSLKVGNLGLKCGISIVKICLTGRQYVVKCTEWPAVEASEQTARALEPPGTMQGYNPSD